MKHFSHTLQSSRGYILPATLMLSLGIAIMSVMLLQVTASSSQTLNTLSYQTIADDAAQSGATYADSCLMQGASWVDAKPLKPSTACDGTGSTGSAYVAQQGSEWRSYFTVAPVDANHNVISTGYVEVLRNGVVVKTYKSTVKMLAAGSYTAYPSSSGESITDVRAEQHACAIANGKLYCWGDNTYGQLGDGSHTDRAAPYLVQGVLAGKTVTKVSVSNTNTCAIADGQAYCWGNNTYGQIGDNTKAEKIVPTAVYQESGNLSGKIVTDISTASSNSPGVMDTAHQHTCAIADGVVYCWGDGGYRQMTGGSCNFLFATCSYPSYTKPTKIYGYNGSSGTVTGLKSQRIMAGSHFNCSAAAGDTYCWGIALPPSIWCAPPGFINSYSMALGPPAYPCTSTYVNPYAAGGVLSSRAVDIDSWDGSTDNVCTMANTDFVCAGKEPDEPGGSILSIPSYSAPAVRISGTDVTDHDSGENSASSGDQGMLCIVADGAAKCAQQSVAYPGTGYANSSTIRPLTTTNTSGIGDFLATKIAAGGGPSGQNFGCVVANGQLFCWGNTSNGTLANGSMSSNVLYPTRTGAAGTMPIGSTSGTYAADGPVSMGGQHACGIIGGSLYCWGNNTYGQLGMGNATPVDKPQTVPASVGIKVTKVSAGANHTCAIISGKLYCWGLNDKGQLGLGNTTNRDTPQLIGSPLTGKRVTDVSAGTDHTCAVANGQAYCWGNNTNNKLGLNSATAYFTTPQLVSGKGDLSTSVTVTKISAGSNHTCAVGNGNGYCWGLNTSGQLGTNNTTTYSTPKSLASGAASTPTGPNSMTPVVSDISAGNDFSCGIFNGKVACWGKSDVGQTGTNSTANKSVATALNGSAGTYYATSVSAGASHACAVINGNSSATNGNIWCWGQGTDGQLGRGSTTSSTVPVLVSGGATVNSSAPTSPVNIQRRVATSISAGASSTCSVANGVILCWGNGADGQLGKSVGSSSVPITSDDPQSPGGYLKGPVF